MQVPERKLELTADDVSILFSFATLVEGFQNGRSQSSVDAMDMLAEEYPVIKRAIATDTANITAEGLSREALAALLAIIRGQKSVASQS
jgi:hypothetical protein